MHLYTPYHQRWAFELNAGRSPSSLARRTWYPWFTTRMSNWDSPDHRTLFHFKTVHFKLALAHRTRRRFWTMFTYGFLFTWWRFSWYLQMAWDCVTDSGFWKYSWAHLVMSMTESCRWEMLCRLRPRRPRASIKGLRPCPLHTDFSSFSEFLMLCTVDDEICKAFSIWLRNVVFKSIPPFFYGQIGEPLSIFTSERLCLSMTSIL